MTYDKPHTEAIERAAHCLTLNMKPRFWRFKCHVCNSPINERITNEISQVYTERKLECDSYGKLITIIPDILIIDNNGLPSLIIEVYQTHKVDDEKVEKLRRLDIPWIEVRASEILSYNRTWHAFNYGNLDKRKFLKCICKDKRIVPLYHLLSIWGFARKVPCPKVHTKVTEETCSTCSFHHGIVEPDKYDYGVICGYK